jgi:hypothetical protein
MKIGRVLAHQQPRGPEGPAGFGVVLFVCATLSLLAWIPLSEPPRLLHSAITDASGGLGLGPGCGQGAATAGYLCSFAGGALAIAPAIVFSLVLFFVRKQLTQWVRRFVSPRLPESAAFLLAPAIATLAFTMSWGYVHATTPYQFGIVPEVLFPALVGLFTFTSAQYGTSILGSVPRLLDARDRVPVWGRLAAVLVIPTLVSIGLMSQRPVTDIDLKQQLIVLISVAIGFAALVPRRAPGVSDASAGGATTSVTGGAE